MLCSVIKYAGGDENTQEVSRTREKHEPQASVSTNTSFVLSSPPAYFITEKATAEASLFVK